MGGARSPRWGAVRSGRVRQSVRRTTRVRRRVSIGEVGVRVAARAERILVVCCGWGWG